MLDIFQQSSTSDDGKVATQERSLGLKEMAAVMIRHAKQKEDDHVDDSLEDGEDEEFVLYDHDLEELRRSDFRVELSALHHTEVGCDLKKKEFPSPGQMASNEVLAKLTTLLKNLHPLGSAEECITLRFVSMIAGGNTILSVWRGHRVRAAAAGESSCPSPRTTAPSGCSWRRRCLADTKAKLRSHGHLGTVGQFYCDMSGGVRARGGPAGQAAAVGVPVL